MENYQDHEGDGEHGRRAWLGVKQATDRRQSPIRHPPARIHRPPRHPLRALSNPSRPTSPPTPARSITCSHPTISSSRHHKQMPTQNHTPSTGGIQIPLQPTDRNPPPPQTQQQQQYLRWKWRTRRAAEEEGEPPRAGLGFGEERGFAGGGGADLRRVKQAAAARWVAIRRDRDGRSEWYGGTGFYTAACNARVVVGLARH